MQVRDIVSRNLEQHLRQNTYPGRGFVIGRAEQEDAWLILYWIMGRSEHSRNRRFILSAHGELKTGPVEASKVADPSLIIYEAMLELPGLYFVGNGDQTRTLYDMLSAGGTFEAAMALCEREPDAPHFTPRITGLLDLRDPSPLLTLSILKANPFNTELTDRYTFRPAAPPAGFGLGLSTYMSDRHPLPSFAGDPLALPLPGSAQDVLDMYWDSLNADNRVALAVKRIPISGEPGEILLRNRFA